MSQGLLSPGLLSQGLLSQGLSLPQDESTAKATCDLGSGDRRDHRDPRGWHRCAQFGQHHQGRSRQRPAGHHPATGSFVFRTANGILPTWESADVRVTGVSPGSAISNFANTYAEVTLPIVAVNGSAHFASGGFRFTNVDTGDFVNCATSHRHQGQSLGLRHPRRHQPRRVHHQLDCDQVKYLRCLHPHHDLSPDDTSGG